MKTLLISTAVLATAGLPLMAAGSTVQEQVQVGSNPSYSFRNAPMNSMGVKSLEDLQGKPVLVEFWGTR